MPGKAAKRALSLAQRHHFHCIGYLWLEQHNTERKMACLDQENLGENGSELVAQSPLLLRKER